VPSRRHRGLRGDTVAHIGNDRQRVRELTNGAHDLARRLRQEGDDAGDVVRLAEPRCRQCTSVSAPGEHWATCAG
jgi:hypothetical protein